ncbi:hypothetical protein NS201_16190 [Pseudomonas oryzihabitans]|nr:hypothetical protein NS201_16190 [Pseudomonas psychrotolerans]
MQGHYQPYIPGMKLPDGVFPPMLGYTHGDLLAAAAVRVDAFLKSKQVDPTLIREALIALATCVNAKFEEEGAEYQISSWYQKPYADRAARARSVERMAEHFGGLAVRGASESMEGSPLLYEGRDFFKGLIGAAGEGVRDLILTLNKSGV